MKFHLSEGHCSSLSVAGSGESLLALYFRGNGAGEI